MNITLVSFLSAVMLVGSMLTAGTANAPAKIMSAPHPFAVTEIVLERVRGGPHPSGHGWPQDKIVLRPQAKTDLIPPDEFLNLATWLKKSGFYARKTGYSTSLKTSDIGYLRIAVMQGNKVKQVYSYNGERDAELWQTEMAIRGVAAAMNLEAQQAMWLRNHKGL